MVVAAASESMTTREFYQNKQFCNYSRIPVYSENEDNVTGYVLRQSILERLAEDKFDLKLSDIKRPILAFPESSPVSNIWEKCLKERAHLHHYRRVWRPARHRHDGRHH